MQIGSRIRLWHLWFNILLCAAILGAVFPAPRAFAQSTSASVSGRVTDQTGAVIPDAAVEIRNTGTNTSQTTKTNGAGVYVFPTLNPGNYVMNVSRQFFRSVSVTGITLSVQENLSRNFVLQVGSTAESITVTENNESIHTTGATVSTLVDRKFVENMPLNGRSFQALITLTPGTVITAGSLISPGQFSVNGQSPESNYFTVDGVSANVGVSASAPFQSAGGNGPGLSAAGGTSALLSVDDMQEFRIQTSTFAPEFGRTPGAQVSIVTRSGTNEFHGTLFEYFRNYHMDSNDWFADAQGLAKPGIHQNDFGGAFGGPVLLPGYNGRNKTFFFFSYEGLRLRSPSVVSTDVPTVAQRQAAVPSIRPFFNAFPVPSPNAIITPTGYAVYAASFSNPTNADATSIRIDQVINSRLSAFARYSDAPSGNISRSLGGGYSPSEKGVTTFGAQTLTGGLNWEISATANNEFRANWSRSTTLLSSVQDNFGGATPLSESALGFPSGVNPAQALSAFVTLDGVGTELLDGLLSNTQLQQLNFVDNFSRLVGRHALKFGVDYRSILNQIHPRAYVQLGLFPDIAMAQTGTALEAAVEAAKPVAGLRYRNISLYAQDTWQTTPRLTVVYGLRWDLNPPPVGTNGFTPYPPIVDLSNPATAALGRAGARLWKTQYTGFAPRLGVSYQLSTRPGWETVFRTGAGIFYDMGTSLTGYILTPNTFPLGANNVFFGIPFPVAGASANPPVIGGPSTATGLISYPAFDPNLKLPRTYEWNVALEQALGANQTVSLTYVGASGQDLLRTEALGPFLNKTFISINYSNNSGASNYNALQLQYNRRLTHNLQALASYSWSHSIDNIPNLLNAIGTFPQLQYAPSRDRGPSDFDVRHAFSASVSYNIPWKSDNGVLRAILGDWSVDGITKDYSAPPVDLVGENPFVAIGLGAPSVPRPNLVPGVPLYLHGSQFPGGKAFNPAAFTTPAPGVQGTLSRNVLRGFNINELDAVLRRQFDFPKGLHLQFRGEFYNIFNHPNFASPGNDITIPQDAAAFNGFGISPSTLASSLGGGGANGGQNPLNNIGGPRSIQLAMKLIF